MPAPARAPWALPVLAAFALACSPARTEEHVANGALQLPLDDAGPAIVALLGTVTSETGAVVPDARVLLVANGRTPGPEQPSDGICDGEEKAWNETRTDSAGRYWAFLRADSGGPVCYAVVVTPAPQYGRRTVLGGVPGVMRGSGDGVEEKRIDVQVLPAD